MKDIYLTITALLACALFFSFAEGEREVKTTPEDIGDYIGSVGKRVTGDADGRRYMPQYTEEEFEEISKESGIEKNEKNSKVEK